MKFLKPTPTSYQELPKNYLPAIDAFREVWVHKTEGRRSSNTTEDKKTYQLFNIVMGEPRGEAAI